MSEQEKKDNRESIFDPIYKGFWIAITAGIISIITHVILLIIVLLRR